jgi:catechol 2,3-dioxygenase-like lactoylglutathione lyase family enzyme
MIDHIGIGAKDFEASRRFYEAALAILGISQIRPEAITGLDMDGTTRDGALRCGSNTMAVT